MPAKRMYKKRPYAKRRYAKKSASSFEKKGNYALAEQVGGTIGSLIAEPWMPLFPASVKKNLRYSTNFTLSTTLGVITGTQVFRANDAFDPDFTAAGHQPMGFDQMMLWYNHFVVVSSNINVIFKNQSNTNPTVCLRVDADSTGLTVIDRIVELGGCCTQVLDLKNVYGGTRKLSMGANIPKLQGVSRSAITSDPNLQGSAAASPSECSYFHVTCWDTAGVSSNIECDAVLEYEVIFLEPRNAPQS